MKKLILILATGFALFFLGCEIEEWAPADMATIEQTQPLGNEKSLEARVDFDVGKVEISSHRAPDVYNLNLEYDRASYQPEIRYESEGRDQAYLHIELESNRKLRLGNQRENNRLNLNLTDSVPVTLKVNTGVGETRLALSNLRLERLDLGAGVGATKISVYEPNPVECERIHLENGVGSLEAIGLGNLNFRNFHFEGGVGGANLEFSGEWQQDADIRIEVGIGGVTVRMPREVGVRVDAAKHFLSGIHLDGFVKRDSDYYSENYENARVRVTVRVSTGIGGFKLRWI